jgi:hypothetical protein
MAEWNPTAGSVNQMQQFRALRRQQGIRRLGQVVGATAHTMRDPRMSGAEALAQRPAVDPDSFMSRREKMERGLQYAQTLQQEAQFNAAAMNEAANLSYREHEANRRAIIAAETALQESLDRLSSVNAQLANSRYLSERERLERERNNLRAISPRAQAWMDTTAAELETLRQGYAGVEFDTALNDAYGHLDDMSVVPPEARAALMAEATQRANNNPRFQQAASQLISESLGGVATTFEADELANVAAPLASAAGMPLDDLIERIDPVHRTRIESAISVQSEALSGIDQALHTNDGEYGAWLKREHGRSAAGQGRTHLDEAAVQGLDKVIQSGQEAKAAGDPKLFQARQLDKVGAGDTAAFSKAGEALGVDKAPPPAEAPATPGLRGAAEEALAPAPDQGHPAGAGPGDQMYGTAMTVMGIPGVTLSEDPTERALQALDLIEKYPEHPPLQQLRMEIFESPEFKAWEEARGVQGARPGWKLRKYNQENRRASRAGHQDAVRSYNEQRRQGIVREGTEEYREATMPGSTETPRERPALPDAADAPAKIGKGDLQSRRRAAAQRRAAALVR